MSDRFSNEEYVDIILIYGLCNMNGRAAQREYRRRFSNRRIPNHTTSQSVVTYAKTNGRFPNTSVPERTGRITEEVGDDILESVQNDPSTNTITHIMNNEHNTGTWR